MTVLNAHFDGQHIVLDDPMPTAVAVNAKVRVIVKEPVASKPGSLQRIAEMAVDVDLPRDFSTQHARYTIGELLAECKGRNPSGELIKGRVGKELLRCSRHGANTRRA